MRNRNLRIIVTALGVAFAGTSPIQGQPSEAPTWANFFAAEEQLREYIEEALARHPAIQQASARYRAALQVVPQVKSLPDPVFSFTQAIRSVETRVGPQQNAVMLSQAFPWFGTLDLQGQVALRKAAAQYHLSVATEREVIAQVKDAYYRLAYIDTGVRITEEELSLLEHYEELAETQYATGQGLQQAILRIQAELTTVLNDLEILDQQRFTLAARLNTLRDRPPEDPIPPAVPLTLPDVVLDPSELYRLGDFHRQELQAANALIEASERSIELAKTSYRPRFTVGAGFVNVGGRRDPAGQLLPPPDNGKNAVSVSLGMTIPLWTGKYRAGVQQAAETLIAERGAYRTIRNEMEFAVQDAVIRAQTLERQVELFETALIPQAEAALQATEAAYETGQLGVLDLLDGERMLLDVQLMNARYYSDFLVALAQLERAIGTRFPRQ